VSARHQLNVAYFNGTLVLAAVIGVVTRSWGVFVAALAVCVVAAVHSGGSWPHPRGR
jgi:hypothetical protein